MGSQATASGDQEQVPNPFNYSRIMQGLVESFGDREAIVNIERNRRLTFRDYHELTNRFAHVLHGPLGLGAGDRYVCFLDNDNLSLFHWATAAKALPTCCHGNFRDSLDTHLSQIETVKPKAALIENSLIESHAGPLAELGIQVVCMDPQENAREGVLEMPALLDAASSDNPDIEIDRHSHIILMRFTGGTTGDSKCARYTADNILACSESYQVLPGSDFSEETRTLHIAPISHGSGMLVQPTMLLGGCTVTMNEPSLELWCQYVEQERITHAFVVPTLAYRLLEMPEAEKFDLSTLKTVFYGAAPMSPSKAKQLVARFGPVFIQAYGSTEHLAVALYLGKEKHEGDDKRLASAGRRNNGIELTICDDDGNPVPRGEVGEFYIRSRGTCQGYEGNPEKTAEEFIDGYWKSGDVGYVDEAGYCYLVDRKKDMIITGGFNVYATEVEAAINSYPGVTMSAVVGIPHEDWGEAIHAEVLLKGQEEVEEQALVAHVKEQIGSVKAPKTVAFVDELPTSVVGKVIRKDVRAKYWKSRDRQIA